MAKFKNPWGKEGKYFPSYIDNEIQDNFIDESLDNSFTDKPLSKYKIILMGGVDYWNEGAYGVNKELGYNIEKLALSQKYNIPLQKGDIKVVNSPLIANELDGKDLYQEVLSLVKQNFDSKDGLLILYGYSFGAQLLMEFLNFFKQDNIQIGLLITVDAAKGFASFAVNNDVTENVKHNLNIYQTNYSKILSHGDANEGRNVTNVNLTGEKNKKGEEIEHANIDDYSLLFVTQVILYALKNIYSFSSMSEAELKQKINDYASKGS